MELTEVWKLLATALAGAFAKEAFSWTLGLFKRGSGRPIQPLIKPAAELTFDLAVWGLIIAGWVKLFSPLEGVVTKLDLILLAGLFAWSFIWSGVTVFDLGKLLKAWRTSAAPA